MSRSIKKGPFIDYNLEKKILAMNESGKKSVIKSWARASIISPDFVGHTIALHNGNKFIKYGGTQIRRICTDTYFQRTRR